MNAVTGVDVARRFYEAVFSPYGCREDLILEVRLLDHALDKCWRRGWHALCPDGFADAAQQSVRWGREGNVLFGVYPRVEQGSSTDSVYGCGLVYVDDDGKGAPKMELPPPHITVSSGRGEHRYHLLSHVFPIEGEPEVNSDEFRQLLIRLDEAAGADRGAATVAQVLRPPSTLNYKYDPPRPVELRRLALELPTQSVKWWDRTLPHVPGPEVYVPPKGYKPPKDPGDIPRRTMNKILTPSPEGSRLNNICKMALHLYWINQPWELIVQLMRHHAQISGFKTAKDWHDFARLLEWVRRKAYANRFAVKETVSS